MKEELYKRIKIAGMISFIPVILAAGPFSGYLIGNYLEKRFGSASYILYISIILGCIISLREAVRIIRLVLKIEKKP